MIPSIDVTEAARLLRRAANVVEEADQVGNGKVRTAALEAAKVEANLMTAEAQRLLRRAL